METQEDIDNEIAEVFGKDKRGEVRAIGSCITKKQLAHIVVAKSKINKIKKLLKMPMTSRM